MRDICNPDLVGADRIVPVASALQVEILTLRHQLNELRRKSPHRLNFSSTDRLAFAGLVQFALGVLDNLMFVAETGMRWHRAGCRAYGAGNQDRAAAVQRPR